MKKDYINSAKALYWYCYDYNTGKNSELYAILSQLKYQPATSENGAGMEDESWSIYEALEDGLLDAADLLNYIND